MNRLMPKPKVVWLVSWWPTEKQPFYGVFNQRWAENIKDSVDLTVVVADFGLPSGLHYDISTKGYRLIRFGQDLGFRGFIGLIQSGIKLLIKIKSWNPDILHVISPIPFARLKPWLVISKDAKLIVTDHTISSRNDLAEFKPRDIKTYWSAFKAADRIHILNVDAGERLMDIGLVNDSHQVEVISNIVPEAHFYRYRAPTNLDTINEYRFLHVSGLDDYQKNVTGIIRAFSEVYKRHPHARLWIGGDGGDKALLIDLVSNLRITNVVRFLGLLDRSQLWSTFDQVGSLVMFSRREVDSVISLEALSVGLPLILAAFCSAEQKTQNGQFGTMVPIEDEIALREAMFAHLESSWRLAKGAPAFLRRMSSEKVILEGFMNLYKT